jgi:hypothetical protein
MKALLAGLAVAILSLSTTNLKADSIVATLDVGLGLGAQTLTATPILNGYQYTYLNTTSVLAFPGIPGFIPALNSTSTTLFSATYLDIAGAAGILNVTDLCAQISIAGKVVPCQALTFSFTNMTFGNTTVLSQLLGTNIAANANVASFALGGGNLALSGGTVAFTNPPSAVPEPSTLCMMATGLLGAAGAARRRFLA